MIQEFARRSGIHIGFSIAGLKRFVVKDPGMLTAANFTVDGKPGTLEKVPHFLEILEKEGKTAISSCLTPNPDGTCPGHEK